MKPRLPLDTLRTLVNAPNGIDQLRMLVYELAFQGRLVEHGIEDARALADHLQRIGGQSYSRNRPQLTVASPFHHIPKHWCWVSMGLVGHDWGQRRPTSDFTYIDVSSIDNRKGIISGDVGVLPANRAPSRARKLVRHGSIIYSTVRPYLLNIAIVDKQFDPMPIASTAFAVLHPHEGIESRYIYHYLRCPAFVRYVESVQSGIAYPAISDRKFFAGSFPLPPLEEQKRIVAKVDELMRLCDRLEAQQQEREKLLPLLSRANHTRFVAEPTSINLQAVFYRPEAALSDDLRKTLSDLAITGLLSHPVAGDSDAKLILDDSLRAKLEYYEENSVRQGARKHSEIIQVVKRVPSHWVMVAAGDLVHLINGRAFKADDWKKSGLPIIRIQNLNNATAPFNYFQGEVSEGHRVRAGDMLLSWSGTPGTSFGAFIWNGGDAVLNQHIFKVAIYSSKISKEYLRMAINASLDALIGSARGGVGLKHVTKGQIESLQIPLPPLEEQNRIVAKLNELIRLCNQLENQARDKLGVSEAFARAAVAAITSTESTENEAMKPPKTDVLTALKVGKKPKNSDAAALAALIANHNEFPKDRKDTQGHGTHVAGEILGTHELTAKELWQLSGLDIDAFYRQLKVEMSHGWIEEDTSKRTVKEVEVG